MKVKGKKLSSHHGELVDATSFGDRWLQDAKQEDVLEKVVARTQQHVKRGKKGKRTAA